MDARDRIPEELLRETDALRRVARGILFEPALAEDAVQEAWLAALRSQKREAHSGGWLTEAVRRIALGLRRQEARRTTREHGGARHEAQPSASDSAARVELLRELLDALEALEEPYRSAVQLRLLDDLPPRAIAAKLGIPVETARTRVKRGIEKLRAQLDARNAHRRGEFLAAFAPLALPSGWKLGLGAYAGSKTILGGMMSAQVKLATALVLILAAGLFWTHPWSGNAPEHAQASATVLPASKTTSQTDPAVPLLEVGMVEDSRSGIASAAQTNWIIRGRALREKHQLLPGASVSLELIAGYDGPGAKLNQQDVSADAKGEYALALPRPESAVRVRAQGNMPGYLCFPSEVLVLRGAGAPSQLDVTCYALDVVVRGHVRDSHGAPIRAAHVGGPMQPVDTDEEGRFELRSSSALLQDASLRAWADGFAEARTSVLARGAGILDGVEFELHPSPALRGRVLDEDGSAVPNAEVKGFPVGHASATSDREGRFTLHGLPADEHWLTLRFQAKGFASLHHDLEDGRIPSEVLTVVLQRGVGLSGQVVDESGQPLPGAQVVAGTSRYDTDSQNTISGDEGLFSFECISRSTRELHVEAAGCAPHQQALALPESGRADLLRIVLERGLTLQGIVLDEQQKALADFDVYVKREGEYIENAGAKTGADGRFTLESLPKVERLVLEVLGAGFIRARTEFDPSSPAEMRVVMQRSAGLAGRVLDVVSGKPITAFRVRFLRGKLEPGEQPMSDYSGSWAEAGREIRDPDGRWDTDGEMLLPGVVTGVEISATGYGPALLDHAVTRLHPETNPIVVSLGAAASIRGHVLETRTGTPIVGAKVLRLRSTDEPGMWGRWDPPSNGMTETDANGDFLLAGVPLESMMLAIEAKGFAPRLDGPFEPRVGTERTIELAAGGTLRGVLRDRQGHALAHEPIMVSGSNGELGKLYRTWQFETDGEGRFELGDLMPATYGASRLLKYEFGSVGDLSQNVTITEARVYEVELRPRGSGSVSGTIQVRGRGAPLLAIMANRTDLPASQVSWRSAIARDCRFQIEGLEPGRWHFAIWEPGAQDSRGGSADADVAATGETSVTIELLER